MDDSAGRRSDSRLADSREAFERLRRGDPALLRQILREYLPSLCHYAQGILRGSGDPQEVAQEALIRLWTHREQWRGDGSIRSLLFTLTRNAALDELRRHRREKSLSEGLLESIPAVVTSPLVQLVEDELQQAATRAIASLPPRRQEIFRLVREGGLSYKEVARVLGISPQTVANLMSLALRDLRTALTPALKEEAGEESGSPPPPSRPFSVRPRSTLHASGSD